ncbi:MAG: hypothetical protein ACOH2D_08095 [Gelidibacter sp.]|uniref:hypothetical protein n=1 Tax=Gelidibacter sp. TaxID=2018083 RepID=UPI0032665B4A
MATENKTANQEIIKEALEFEQQTLRSLSTSDRIEISRQAKTLILGLNEIYKRKKDEQIMDIMKRLTVIKQKVEKRLKGKPLTATS